MTTTVLLVGAGGIAAPCALVLARAWVRERAQLRLMIADDDLVERSNLHRQILFTEDDVGSPKLDAMQRALAAHAPGLAVELVRSRMLPDNALELTRAADLVIDATDNFATRFLAADAAHLAARPIVHAASVRWHATVLASSAQGAPCYRCLFEDLPDGDAPDCATAGVVGPVCGVAGALAADLALRWLAGAEGAFGFVLTFDGRKDVLRKVPLRARRSCALCGSAPSILSIDASRYLGPSCASTTVDDGGDGPPERRENG